MTKMYIKVERDYEEFTSYLCVRVLRGTYDRCVYVIGMSKSVLC